MEYAVGALFALALWAIFFAVMPGSRRVMVIAGAAFAPTAPVLELWHVQDYWQPDYLLALSLAGRHVGVEDLVLGFAYAGVSAGVFDVLVRRGVGASPLRPCGSNIVRLATILVLSLLAAMFVLVHGVELGSVTAVIVLSLGAAALVLVQRPRWVPAALGTGLVVAALVWLAYAGFFLRLYPEIFDRWWYAEALSGRTLGGIPVEELAWAGSTALVPGPALRFALSTRPAPTA